MTVKELYDLTLANGGTDDTEIMTTTDGVLSHDFDKQSVVISEDGTQILIDLE